MGERERELQRSYSRREFLKLTGGIGVGGLVLGSPTAWAQEASKTDSPAWTPKVQTNIQTALAVPRTEFSLPGLFPGRVVEIRDPRLQREGKTDPGRIRKDFHEGILRLTGKKPSEAFKLFFSKSDTVGIKVNPVGAGQISTHTELVDSVIQWLREGGLSGQQIVIWDRFEPMMKDAGFTAARFPGVRIEALQTIDESAAEGKSNDNSRWLGKDGHHLSEDRFDRDIFYWADVEAPQDLPYLNQHVFNGKESYFGKLITKGLTKIINLPAFKNTGNGISMATKNLGYGSICNTGRLHKPLFFHVNTEVLAFPCLRDKVVLNIVDGIKGQYDGGPDAVPKFIYDLNTLFFSTDPFAVDAVCHQSLLEKRLAMGVKVNRHPMFSEYLRYAQRLGLGIGEVSQIKHVLLG